MAQEREIDGMTFGINLIPARKAFLYSAELIRMLAPALEKGGAALSGGGDRAGALLSAVPALLQSLEEKALGKMLDLLLEGAVITQDGKTQPLKPVFDLVFRAKQVTLLKLLAWALEENYADFFDLARGPLGAALAAGAARASTNTPPVTPSR